MKNPSDRAGMHYASGPATMDVVSLHLLITASLLSVSSSGLDQEVAQLNVRKAVMMSRLTIVVQPPLGPHQKSPFIIVSRTPRTSISFVATFIDVDDMHWTCKHRPPCMMSVVSHTSFAPRTSEHLPLLLSMRWIFDGSYRCPPPITRS